jgi:phosphoribosylanthranilate isomerase
MIDKAQNQPRRTRIKICGIQTVEHALVATDAGADAIGLMFVEKSPRYVREFEAAVDILTALPPFVTPVGVFQLTRRFNADFEDWCQCADWCQFHGDEDEQTVALAARPPRRAIRGFRFDADQVRRWDSCGAVEALLIDGPAGGSGEGFDHAQLADMMPQISKPVILAGGLTPENVGDAIRIVRPFAVDVSSGVESTPGVKEPSLIREFCAAVREASR